MAEKQPRDDGDTFKADEFKPRGTVAYLIVYALVTIALWGTVYLTLLGRGVTTP